MSTAANERTAQHRLLDLLMMESEHECNLKSYVMLQRGRRVSWRLIAQALHKITDEDLSPPTLMTWFGEDPDVVAAYENAER